MEDLTLFCQEGEAAIKRSWIQPILTKSRYSSVARGNHIKLHQGSSSIPVNLFSAVFCPLSTSTPALGAGIWAAHGDHCLHWGWAQQQEIPAAPFPISLPCVLSCPGFLGSGRDILAGLPHPATQIWALLSTEAGKRQPWPCSKCSRTGVWSWMVQFRHQIMCVCGTLGEGLPAPASALWTLIWAQAVGHASVENKPSNN